MKRLCIEMITKPFCRVVGKKMYSEETPCGEDKYSISHTIQSQEFEDYSTQAKFLEQVIDWDLMSYIFYPYYWADKCSWAELMQSKDDDILFQNFLQSGMARLVVPVRLEMTEAAIWYLRTGEIWTGGAIAPGASDPLYISIMDEMQKPLGVVEGSEWETRVPSMLTIIQKESAYLDGVGLPCCDPPIGAPVSNEAIAVLNTTLTAQTPTP
jgi:hypothetical protein